MIDAAVIGGGISGLAAALKLRNSGYAVKVYESASVAGGKIRSQRLGRFQVESGPHSFLGSSHAVWRLLGDSSLVDSARTAQAESRFRYIYRDGKIHPIPMNPIAFISSNLISARGKLRLVAEPFMRGAASAEDTVHSFITRRLGKEAADFLAGPFVSGIYAGDPHRLGAFDSFPALWRMEHESGSLLRGALAKAFSSGMKSNGLPRRRGLFSFPGGLGVLTRSLASALGPSLLLNSKVSALSREGSCWRVMNDPARVVIVAIPPHQAAPILPSEMADLLSQIRLTPVAVVHLGSQADGARIPRGFGCLVPRFYGIRTLGIVFVSQLFPGRAPSGGYLLTAFIGGALDREAIRMSNAQLVRIAVEDVKKTLRLDISPDFTHVQRHEHAIPQLEIGHRKRIERLIEIAGSHPGLFLAGNYLKGVGINDAVASGYLAAERAVRYLSRRGGP